MRLRGDAPRAPRGADATWLRLAVLTYNVLTALYRLALSELLAARPKRLRFLVPNIPGKLAHHSAYNQRTKR